MYERDGEKEVTKRAQNECKKDASDIDRGSVDTNIIFICCSGPMRKAVLPKKTIDLLWFNNEMANVTVTHIKHNKRK